MCYTLIIEPNINVHYTNLRTPLPDKLKFM